MADRGRDLSFDLRTDTSKFDLSEPAKELDDLGAASKDAAQGVEKTTDELKRLAAQGKDAQRALDALNREVAANKFDQMGRDAQATATKVDHAFDTIGKSAKSNFKGLGDEATHGMHEAGKSTEEFRDEAKQNISEVASSFQGDMTSAIDVVQGTLGGLVSSIPGIGGALAGIAAVGAGALVGMFQKTQEAAEKARESANGFFQAFVTGGGRLRAEQILQQVETNITDVDSAFSKAKASAAQFGLSLSDLALATSGDLPATERLNAAIDAQIASIQEQVKAFPALANVAARWVVQLNGIKTTTGLATTAMTQGKSSFDTYADAAAKLGATIDPVTGQLTTTAQAITDTGNAAADAAPQIGTFSQAMEDAADPSSVFETLMEKAKTAAEKAKTPFKAAGAVTADAYLRGFEAQIRAKESFSRNLATLAARGVDEGFLETLREKGPEVASEVALLMKLSPAQVARLNADLARDAAGNVDTIATTIAGKKQDVSNAAHTLHNAIEESLDVKVSTPVGLKNQQDTINDAHATHEEVQSALAEHVPQPVKLTGREQASTDAHATHEEVQSALAQQVPIPTFVQPPPSIGTGSSANAAEHALNEAQAYAKAHPITIYATIVPVPKQP